MTKVKITVLNTTLDRELAQESGAEGLSACPMLKEGQEFYADYAKPEGFCDEAWKAVYQYVFALAHGEEPTKTGVQVPEGVVLGENEYYGEDENAMGGKLSLKVTYVDGVIKAITVLEQHEGEL